MKGQKADVKTGRERKSWQGRSNASVCFSWANYAVTGEVADAEAEAGKGVESEAGYVRKREEKREALARATVS